MLSSHQEASRPPTPPLPLVVQLVACGISAQRQCVGSKLAADARHARERRQSIVTRCKYYERYTTEEALEEAAKSYGGLK